MVQSHVRRLISLLFAACAAACGDATGPDTQLVLTAPPDLVAVVASTRYEGGFSPQGPMSQFAVWIAVPPSTKADAGVVVGASTPVFIRQWGRLIRTTASMIAPGDSIHVWHDASVAYGAVESPPGAPCYMGTQILILR